MNLKIFLLLLGWSVAVTAQNRKTPAVVRYLLNYPETVPVINGHFSNVLPVKDLDPALQQQNQYLLKTADHLYCGINGTGRLYELSDKNGMLFAKRIDSTYFYGHNFGAAKFTLDNKLYSLGGYGFWKSNGLLRKYNSFTRDWTLHPLNRELPYMENHSSFWLDASNQLFYLANPVQQNQGLFADSLGAYDLDPQLYQLDLKTGIWQALGHVAKSKPNDIRFQSQWGSLVVKALEKPKLYDYRNNKIYEGGDNLTAQLKKIFRSTTNVQFCIDSTVYFASIEGDYFDSVSFSRNDFRETAESIYTAMATTPTSYLPEIAKRNYLWLLIIPLAAGALLFGYRREKKPKISIPPTDADSPPVAATEPITAVEPVPASGRIPFNNIEKELIVFLLNKCRQKERLSVEDINKFLGLSDKNEAVQKKNRNSILYEINMKWAALHNQQDPLIERRRSEFDKRSVEYTLNPRWVETASRLWP